MFGVRCLGVPHAFWEKEQGWVCVTSRAEAPREYPAHSARGRGLSLLPLQARVSESLLSPQGRAGVSLIGDQDDVPLQSVHL